MLRVEFAKEERTIYILIYLVVEQEAGLSIAPKTTPPTWLTASVTRSMVLLVT